MADYDVSSSLPPPPPAAPPPPAPLPPVAQEARDRLDAEAAAQPPPPPLAPPAAAPPPPPPPNMAPAAVPPPQAAEAPPPASGTVTEVHVQVRDVRYTESANGTPNRGVELVVGFRGVPDPGTSASAFERRLFTAARTLCGQQLQEVIG
jgi:hypothetical protein